MATIGLAWDLTNPKKPVAEFDEDAIRNIPMNINDWLDDIGSTYASHEIICATGLMCTDSAENAGVITATIKKDPSETRTLNAKYGVTYRFVAANGESDDRTLYLKIVQR